MMMMIIMFSSEGVLDERAHANNDAASTATGITPSRLASELGGSELPESSPLLCSGCPRSCDRGVPVLVLGASDAALS